MTHSGRSKIREMKKVFAKVVGPMPPFYKVGYELWGDGADFDSDGDSHDPESTEWRELTLIKRPKYDLRIDIDPISEDRDIIELQSESSDLIRRTLAYLVGTGSVVALESK